MKKEVGQVARVVGVGYQDFGKIRENNCFYIDKSRFIKEWWDQADQVTLITRPRRFGKTLTYRQGKDMRHYTGDVSQESLSVGLRCAE